MVIRFVAHSDFLFLNFSPELAVDMDASARSGQRAILEDPAHVVEQAGGRQHNGGRTEVTLPFQEELSVLVSLGGGAAEDLLRLPVRPAHRERTGCGHLRGDPHAADTGGRV